MMNRLQYYRRLADIFFSYRRKKAVLSYLPVRLWVEPTSHCNLQCVMCPNKDLEKEKKGYMEFGLFQKIIDEARDFVFDIHLLHRGESLLHPEFFRMARYAHESGIVTRFHTNGTLLDEEKSHKLIESGIDQFAFSFDGFDKETHESIRIKSTFEKTVGNIIRFLEIKKSLKAKKPVTVLELINFPDRYKGLERRKKREFLGRFKGLPLDKIEIKEMHNWAGEIGRIENHKNYTPCTFLWHALIVLWDGSVLPCTQDFHGLLDLGNVREASLTKIWNSERMVSLRKKILSREVEGLRPCAGCDRLWRKQFLGIPTEFLWRFLLKRML